MSLLQQEPYDVRRVIADYLNRKGIKKNHIADNIAKSRTHVSKILKCEREITIDVLNAINELLGTSFTKEKPVIEPAPSSMRATG